MLAENAGETPVMIAEAGNTKVAELPNTVWGAISSLISSKTSLLISEVSITRRSKISG